MSRLEALRDAGVSIWLDTLWRALLETGAVRATRRRSGKKPPTSGMPEEGLEPPTRGL
jgi:hypothetical protein